MTNFKLISYNHQAIVMLYFVQTLSNIYKDSLKNI